MSVCECVCFWNYCVLLSFCMFTGRKHGICQGNDSELICIYTGTCFVLCMCLSGCVCRCVHVCVFVCVCIYVCVCVCVCVVSET